MVTYYIQYTKLYYINHNNKCVGHHHEQQNQSVKNARNIIKLIRIILTKNTIYMSILKSNSKKNETNSNYISLIKKTEMK